MSSINNIVYNVYLNPAPKGLQDEFKTLFTDDAVKFLIDLNLEFQSKIDQLYTARYSRKYELAKNPKIPEFLNTEITDLDWRVAPVKSKLENRHLDLGDVSPSNLDHFTSALRAEVQGIQVDFDDGHCPTWRNQISGLYNIYQAVHNKLPNIPPISKLPILMFRPRAWNILEHNISINGREIPGPLLDFGLIIFHNGLLLSQRECGPFFYLSKIQGSSEAKLWNEIFTWSQSKLGIPHGTIKACVLIEDILSSFEMDQILYELKDHSLGLNCGIWDYAASVIVKFGTDAAFVLPDRNKYVNMSKHFLKKYMELVVRTCHKRNAHATGGMAAKLLPEKIDLEEYREIVRGVYEGKLAEIKAGVDGFMVFDLRLVSHMNKLWKDQTGNRPNQISYLGKNDKITGEDLLKMPTGGVTMEGVLHNISVAILFIYNWLEGRGCFPYKGSVEDSATAEISRAQVWQWIRHGAKIENQDQIITREFIYSSSSNIIADLMKEYGNSYSARKKLIVAFDLFLEIVNLRELPEYITTYLNDAHVFRKAHSNL